MVPPPELSASAHPQALVGSQTYLRLRTTSCSTARALSSGVRGVSNPSRRCRPQRTFLSCSAAKSEHGEETSTKKDPLKLFAQAQQNMMVLNQSRLKALEELKSAQQKISELQEELESTKRELTVAQSIAQQADVDSSAAAGVAVAVEQPFQVEQPPARPLAEVPSPPPTPPPHQAPAKDLITIRYRTGWKHAYVHCNVNGKGWTTTPGIRMSGNGDNKELVLEGSRMEFVINNGGDDWDTPDPFNDDGPKNYTVRSPGVYVLSSGKLRKQG